MQRDWELVRKILFKLEASGHPNANITAAAFEDYDAVLVGYHFHILKQANLIDASLITTGAGISGTAMRLTWEGHEFLDAVRSETVWNNVKGRAASTGMDLPFAVIKTMASEFLKHLLGL